MSDDELSCPRCNYTPGVAPRPDVGKFLSEHGYEDDFIYVPYGPEKEGTVAICPLCGELAGRGVPENQIFLLEKTEEVDVQYDGPGDLDFDPVEIPEWEVLIPTHLEPAEGEPQLCVECRSLIQPSDSHRRVTDPEGSEVWLCSDDCHDAWKAD